MISNYSFDMAIRDLNEARAMPLPRGVYPPSKWSEGVKFMSNLKTSAKFFKEDVYNGKLIDGNVYVGDAWINFITSTHDNVYKNYRKVYEDSLTDTLLHVLCIALGMPTSMDTILYWDSNGDPVWNACNDSVVNRQEYRKWAVDEYTAR